MKQTLTQEALAQLFVEARTFNAFTDRPVTDEVTVQLYDLFKWGTFMALASVFNACEAI